MEAVGKFYEAIIAPEGVSKDRKPDMEEKRMTPKEAEKFLRDAEYATGGRDVVLLVLQTDAARSDITLPLRSDVPRTYGAHDHHIPH